MILDKLEYSKFYLPIHPSFEKAFAFLSINKRESLPVGCIEINGEDSYAVVQEYITKLPNEGIWEAHRKYLDIHYIVEGVERIGIAPISQMELGVYNPERDFQSMTGNGQMIELYEGSFVIFFPQDAHMPGLATDSRTPVRKIVIKCLLGSEKT
jgi:biofilm protein TabA